MEKPKQPAGEAERLEALRRLNMLDTGPEERFDRLTRLAQSLMGTPTALVTLVDAERQWFKSRQGLDVKQTPRDVSFCAHAILGKEPFIVLDASKDPRFSDNPLVVSSPNIRFYAGVPLRLATGEAMGALCVMDRIPRTLDPRRLQLLRDLAALVVNELEGATLEVARAAVRERESQYRSLLDETTDLILNLDGEGRLVDAGGTLLKALGRTAEEAARAGLEGLLAPESREAFAALAARAARGEASGDIKAAFLSRSGERLLARGSAFVQLENGRATRVRVVLRDVTALTRAENLLAAREAAAKALAEEASSRAEKALLGAVKETADVRAALDASAIVVATDAGGRITSVNEEFTRVSGFSREEIVGKTHRIVRSGTHPESFFKRLWEEIAAGRTWRGEICNRAKSGEAYWVSTTITPFLDEGGKPFQYLAISRDVTGLKLAETRAAEAGARLQAVLDSAVQVSIVAVDASGRVTVFNKGAERLFGYTAAELLGRPAALLHSEADGFDALLESIRPGVAETKDCTCVRKDRSSFPARLTVTALRGPAGETSGFLAVAVDATEFRQAREEASKARDVALDLANVKSRFLSNMSREIRAPMNAVVGLAGLLLDTGLTPPQRELAAGVRGAGESLLTTLGDILDYSRIEAGGLPLEESEFDPSLVVEDVALLFAARAREKGLGLAAFVDADLPAGVRGDAARVRQVVGGFVDNAIKFTEKGEIVVAARRVSEEGGAVRVRFEVQDTGAGLDAAAQAKLFSPFSQADAAPAGGRAGAGLGLAIAQRLADMMRGSVGAASAPGKGSTFWFEAAFAKGDAAAPPDAPGLAGVRVLVVDGSEAGRRITAHLAASWRMRPEAAADGASALAALRGAEAKGDPFILALIDAQLPDMDAAQLVQEIKGDAALVAVRMILVGSAPASAGGEEAAAQLFDGVLAKPVLKLPLQDAVCAALGVPATTQALARRALRAVPLASWKELRILVADDNALSRGVLRHQLGSLGCRSDGVADGREALAAAAAVPYDLILMDCVMPEMDGFAAAAAIRARPAAAGRRLAIIAMTTNALAGDRERYLAAGMDDYVSKPVRVEELAAAIGRCFGSVDPAALQRLREMGDDGAVKNLLDGYAADAQARLAGLRAAAAGADAAVLESLSQALKGSSGTLGARGVERLAARLEALAREKRFEEAVPLVAALESELAGTLQLLRAGGLRTK
jgi:PAS domain S-box-containing protein